MINKKVLFDKLLSQPLHQSIVILIQVHSIDCELCFDDKKWGCHAFVIIDLSIYIYKSIQKMQTNLT